MITKIFFSLLSLPLFFPSQKGEIKNYTSLPRNNFALALKRGKMYNKDIGILLSLKLL